MSESASMFVLGSFVAACSAKVARLPSPGESLEAAAFVLEAGGKGFNLAVGSRRLGAEVDGLLAIGDDLFAGLAEAALRDAGLPQRMLQRFPGPSGAGVGFTDRSGENCLAVYPGANALLSDREVRAAAARLRRAKAVVAQFEIGDSPILAAFAEARRNGTLTILNPSPFRPIDARILSNTTFIIVNRVEAANLARVFDLAVPSEPISVVEGLAEQLFARGVEGLIVTLGHEGALAVARGGNSVLQPAFPVEAVDTLGAGDAFTAAFATALLNGASLADCLRAGAAAGALAAARLGVLAALPTAGQVAALLSAQETS